MQSNEELGKSSELREGLEVGSLSPIGLTSPPCLGNPTSECIFATCVAVNGLPLIKSGPDPVNDDACMFETCVNKTETGVGFILCGGTPSGQLVHREDIDVPFQMLTVNSLTDILAFPKPYEYFSIEIADEKQAGGLSDSIWHAKLLDIHLEVGNINPHVTFLSGLEGQCVTASCGVHTVRQKAEV